jgi:phosphoribosylformylglycinamidine (FGAM) synthase-like amidotransferase family enzyme
VQFYVEIAAEHINETEIEADSPEEAIERVKRALLQEGIEISVRRVVNGGFSYGDDPDLVVDWRPLDDALHRNQ